MNKQSDGSDHLLTKPNPLAPISPSEFKTGDPSIDAIILAKDISLAEVSKLKDFVHGYGKQHRLRSVFKCKGADCISAHICPFIKINRTDLLPVDKPCPVDTMLATQMYDEMEHYVRESLDVENLDVFTESYIRELTAIEVYIARIEDKISQDADTGNDYLTSQHVGTVNTRTGDAYYERTEHYLLPARDRLLNRKDRVLKSLLLTPEAKARFKKGKGKSVAEKVRDLQTVAISAIRELEKRGDVNLDEIKRRVAAKQISNNDNEQTPHI